MALHLDDAFHSPWFIAITAFLCLNLLMCNLLRLPRLIRRTRAEARPEAALKLPGDVSAPDIQDAEAVFRQLRMPRPTPCKSEDGRDALFAARNTPGLWGPWICHLGILLLILGFGLGQMTQRQYAVYGVPGQNRRIGDTECFLTIDDFRMDKRADGSVAQYTTDITVENVASAGGKDGSASISVNHPAKLCGMKFYQNATGWAAQVDVYKDGAPIQQEVVCAGDYLSVKDKEGLVVLLNAFYPDYVMTPGVGPSTAIIAYGAFGVSFVLSIIFLLRDRMKASGFLDQHIPDREKLDMISYRSVSLGLLFLTFTIITGAIWAERAWGSYWSWDPKETWSLVTWIIYAIYLHLRLRKGWRGRSAAIFCVVGFICVLFTYLGVNTWLPEVHSYA